MLNYVEYFGPNIIEGVAESWVELGGGGWSWVKLGARFSNTHLILTLPPDAFHKTFWGAIKKSENKDLSSFSIFVQDRDGKITKTKLSFSHVLHKLWNYWLKCALVQSDFRILRSLCIWKEAINVLVILQWEITFKTTLTDWVYPKNDILEGSGVQ